MKNVTGALYIDSHKIWNSALVTSNRRSSSGREMFLFLVGRWWTTVQFVQLMVGITLNWDIYTCLCSYVQYNTKLTVL